ncbi:Aspartyl protease family protein At5g10770 [Linum perenne]
MVMLSFLTIIIKLLLLFPLLCNGVVSATAAAAAAIRINKLVPLLEEHNQWKQQLLLNTRTTFNHSSSSSSCLPHQSKQTEGATILEMKHRDFCSSPTIQDWTNKQHKTLTLDNFRVQSIQSRIKRTTTTITNLKEDATNSSTATTQIPLASGIRLETLNYIVTVQLGGKPLTVIIDTGSDLTWVQCQPCRLCYNQKDPLFNPSISTSFQRLPCTSSACKSLELATGNSGVCGSYPPTCNYLVSYGDGSYTRGDLATEQLNLGGVPISNFIFGCGRNNKGLFGGASGLMGLGRSDLSLVSQSESIYGGVFSYCLPTTAPDASGSLAFGANTTVYNNFTPISYTRMVPNPQLPTFYFLNLTGMTIGGNHIQASSFGSGILIDSGTVISRLPPSLYNAVKDEFLRQLSGVPSAPSFSILDTCFNLTGYQEIDVPTISMNFEWNVALEVDLTGVFYFAKADASQVCLAIASLAYEDEIGILGNYQQRNQRVVYDTKRSMVGFAAESCSFS